MRLSITETIPPAGSNALILSPQPKQDVRWVIIVRADHDNNVDDDAKERCEAVKILTERLAAQDDHAIRFSELRAHSQQRLPDSIMVFIVDFHDDRRIGRAHVGEA